MKTKQITLDRLPLNKKGIIEHLYCDDNIKRRMLDLGLVKGTNITPILVSPSGDPTAFEIRGTIIAIRKEETNKIYVSQ